MNGSEIVKEFNRSMKSIKADIWWLNDIYDFPKEGMDKIFLLLESVEKIVKDSRKAYRKSNVI